MKPLSGRVRPLVCYTLLSLILLTLTTPIFALSAGNLDPSFGSGGFTTLDLGNVGDVARDVIRLPDGKLVVVGSVFNGANDDFVIMRFAADGTLDTSFGTMGRTLTDFGSSADIAYAVALQADGRLVVTGSTNLGGDLNFAVARYTSAGVLDTTFSGDGLVVTEVSTTVNDSAYDLAIDSNGRIVVGGGLYVSSIDDNAVVIRYTSAGALDTTFGTGGIANIAGTGSSWLRGLTIDGAGKIVGIGRFNNMIRLDTGGTLDTTFDGDGRLSINPSLSDDYGERVINYPGGKYIVVHTTESCLGCTQRLTTTRINNNGTFDNTFSNDSVAELTLNGYSGLASYDAVVDEDGKVVVVGTLRTRDDNDYSGLVTRFNANGSLDTTFSGDGWATFGTGTGEDRFYGVTLTPDDQIIAVGTTAGNSINQDIVIAALLAVEVPPPAEPTLTSPANNAAFTTTTLPNPLTFAWGAANGATSYTLLVKEDGLFGNTVISKSGLTATSYDLSAEERALLVEGVYDWRVTAVGKGGTTPSNERSFSITVPLPSIPVLTSPTADEIVVGDASPAFVWAANPPAEAVSEYRLFVRNASNVVLFNQAFAADTICVSGVCTVDLGALAAPVNLKNGAYSYRVRGSNSAGFKQTPFRAFRIVFPGRPGLVSPVDNSIVNDFGPLFTWDQVPSAAQYRLTVRNAAKKIVTRTQWLDSATMGCNGTTCAFDITPTGLKNGAHTWVVEARNTAVITGVSKSVQGKFRVAYPGVPALESPIANETVTVASPIFTWAAVENAAEYELLIRRTATPTPPALKQKFTAETICVEGVCSVDLAALPKILKKGAHTWQVTAIAPGGYRSKSVSRPFKVTLP